MDHDDSGLLEHDLLRWTSTFTRRRALGMLAGASVVPIVGCSDSMLLGDGGGLGDSGAGGDGGASGTCESVPAETAGP